MDGGQQRSRLAGGRRYVVTEWNALGYEKISALQQTMAAEVLATLDLKDVKRVVDLGCGNGRITAAIASRLPGASVLGIDASREMISYAQEHFGVNAFPNLDFAMEDICKLAFQDEFDTVLSFNALHWIPDQGAALATIYRVMREGGSAHLRLVPRGQRKSLEDVLEDTRSSARWASAFEDFHDPYLHVTAEEYRALAEAHGLRVMNQYVQDKAWDFGSRDGFFAFASVTTAAWFSRLPAEARPSFLHDVLERYAAVAGDDHTFRFYQMNIQLMKPS
jgi:trans-aconitate 2-methyltransferase